MKRTEEKLKKALNALGVTGTVEAIAVTNHPEESRYAVQVDGEEYGVYDMARETFVD